MRRSDFRQVGVTRFFVILELDVISFAGLKERSMVISGVETVGTFFCDQKKVRKKTLLPAARTSAMCHVSSAICQDIPRFSSRKFHEAGQDDHYTLHSSLFAFYILHLSLGRDCG
jgi:hypothetical protein